MGFETRHDHASAGRATIPQREVAEATPAQKATSAKNLADNRDRYQQTIVQAVQDMTVGEAAGDRAAWPRSPRPPRPGRATRPESWDRG